MRKRWLILITSVVSAIVSAFTNIAEDYMRDKGINVAVKAVEVFNEA